jgi:hypothetical protein
LQVLKICEKEEAVHDVGFMNAGDFLTIVSNGIVKGKFDGSFSVCSGANFQRLNDAWDGLMF